jgi:uncharacterized protein YfdQ (DUF2303 family)
MLFGTSFGVCNIKLKTITRMRKRKNKNRICLCIEFCISFTPFLGSMSKRKECMKNFRREKDEQKKMVI